MSANPEYTGVGMLADNMLLPKAYHKLNAEYEQSLHGLFRHEARGRTNIEQLSRMSASVGLVFSESPHKWWDVMFDEFSAGIDVLKAKEQWSLYQVYGREEVKAERAVCSMIERIGYDNVIADTIIPCARHTIINDESIAWNRLAKSFNAGKSQIIQRESRTRALENLLLEESRVRATLETSLLIDLQNNIDAGLELIRDCFKPPGGVNTSALPQIDRSIGKVKCFDCRHNYVGGTTAIADPRGEFGSPSVFSTLLSGKCAYQSNLLGSPGLMLFPGDFLYSIVGEKVKGELFEGGDLDLEHTLGVASDDRSFSLRYLGIWRLNAVYGSKSHSTYVQLGRVMDTPFCEPLGQIVPWLTAPIRPLFRLLTSQDATVYRDLKGPFKARVRIAFDIVSKRCPPVLVSCLNDLKLACLEGHIEMEPGLALRLLKRTYLRVHPEGWPAELH